MAIRCQNGTIIILENGGSRVILPDGHEVFGRPQGTPEQAQTALDLGYGEDVLAMVREHDPLHALLTDWLGLPYSFSLAEPYHWLAPYEEAAVIATQRFLRHAGLSL